jgi:hypothetical protein
MPAAALGAENPLPPLTSADLRTAVPRVASAGEQMARNLAYGKVSSILPYTLQDGYSRDLVDTTLTTAIVQNEVIRAEFLLDFGGRMWSLVHLPTGRELLHRNPTLQLGNLALRNAWFAGGVEWNLGTTGHTGLTCAPMHAARVVRTDGIEVLRLWEWERMRELVYQLDIWAPPGSEVLFVQVRISNPKPHATPVYWWSNMAVPLTSEVRVSAPAARAWLGQDESGLDYVVAPSGDPLALDHASDHFYDIPDGDRKWIAALDTDGAGLVQTSSDRLLGRKLFLWGAGRGAQRWQEWLSPPGHPYLEIQAGLARTQLEHLSLPGRESWSWTEAYGLLRADGDIPTALERLIPRTTLEGVQGCPDQPPTRMLHTGSGWGALEQRLWEFELPGTPFVDAGISRVVQPWSELLNTGDLPVPDPAHPPLSYAVGSRWLARLEAASDTWFTQLHRGVARYHADDIDGAVAAWDASLTLAPNAWALRNLAVVAHQRGDSPAAVDLLRRAHTALPGQRAITIELLRVLVAVDPAGAVALVDELPPEQRAHGRIQLLECRAAIAAGQLTRAAALLDSGMVIDDLREGEDSLADLWLGYHRARLGPDGPPTAALLEQRYPVPAIYDFRMKA